MAGAQVVKVVQRCVADVARNPVKHVSVYVGDDLTDLAVLRMAGLGATPRDAAPELRDAAGWVLEHGGGHGAVREVIEGVLRAQGRWESAVAAVSAPRPPGPHVVGS